MVGSRHKFTQTEMHYLRMLPAVANVTSSRITYSDDFREAATARYLRGDSPVRIFRDAGLDPKLIGYKRIERAFARWRGNAQDGTFGASVEKTSLGRAQGLGSSFPNDGRRDVFPAAVQGARSTAKSADSENEAGEAQESRPDDNDLRDRLIVEQALCIARLEERIKELEQELALPQSVADAVA